MHQFAVQDHGDNFAEIRQQCDVTGTSFAAACGLDDGKSRTFFWELRKGLRTDNRPPPDVREMLDLGTAQEPYAALAFAASGLLAPGEFLCHYGQQRRRAAGYLFGVHLDRLIYSSRPVQEPVRLLEIKTVQSDLERGMPAEPKMRDVMQTLLQLWCMRLEHGHLFYWRKETGEWASWRVRLDSFAFTEGPLSWAFETLEAQAAPKRMPSELKRERTEFVRDHFLV